MTHPTIRPLDPLADRAVVERFIAEAADYIRLERGEEPGPGMTNEFFAEAPPGCDPSASLRLGLFDGQRLIAIAEAAFGFPEPDDAYLGLMIVAPAARGAGGGARFLRHIEAAARAQGKQNLYLAVLDANPRGQAFWESQGFAVVLRDRPVTMGRKTQTAKRLLKRL